jgi:hypothetical protein
MPEDRVITIRYAVDVTAAKRAIDDLRREATAPITVPVRTAGSGGTNFGAEGTGGAMGISADRIESLQSEALSASAQRRIEAAEARVRREETQGLLARNRVANAYEAQQLRQQAADMGPPEPPGGGGGGGGRGGLGSFSRLSRMASGGALIFEALQVFRANAAYNSAMIAAGGNEEAQVRANMGARGGTIGEIAGLWQDPHGYEKGGIERTLADAKELNAANAVRVQAQQFRQDAIYRAGNTSEGGEFARRYAIADQDKLVADRRTKAERDKEAEIINTRLKDETAEIHNRFERNRREAGKPFNFGASLDAKDIGEDYEASEIDRVANAERVARAQLDAKYAPVYEASERAKQSAVRDVDFDRGVKLDSLRERGRIADLRASGQDRAAQIADFDERQRQAAIDERDPLTAVALHDSQIRERAQFVGKFAIDDQRARQAEAAKTQAEISQNYARARQDNLGAALMGIGADTRSGLRESAIRAIGTGNRDPSESIDIIFRGLSRAYLETSTVSRQNRLATESLDSQTRITRFEQSGDTLAARLEGIEQRRKSELEQVPGGFLNGILGGYSRSNAINQNADAQRGLAIQQDAYRREDTTQDLRYRANESALGAAGKPESQRALELADRALSSITRTRQEGGPDVLRNSTLQGEIGINQLKEYRRDLLNEGSGFEATPGTLGPGFNGGKDQDNTADVVAKIDELIGIIKDATADFPSSGLGTSGSGGSF